MGASAFWAGMKGLSNRLAAHENKMNCLLFGTIGDDQEYAMVTAAAQACYHRGVRSAHVLVGRDRQHRPAAYVSRARLVAGHFVPEVVDNLRLMAYEDEDQDNERGIWATHFDLTELTRLGPDHLLDVNPKDDADIRYAFWKEVTGADVKDEYQEIPDEPHPNHVLFGAVRDIEAVRRLDAALVAKPRGFNRMIVYQ